MCSVLLYGDNNLCYAIITSRRGVGGSGGGGGVKDDNVTGCCYYVILWRQSRLYYNIINHKASTACSVRDVLITDII